jgi:hypothetical protein
MPLHYKCINRKCDNYGGRISSSRALKSSDGRHKLCPVCKVPLIHVYTARTSAGKRGGGKAK